MFLNNTIDTELYSKLGLTIANNEIQYKSVEHLDSFLAKRADKLDIELGDKAIKDFIIQVDYYQRRGLIFGIIDNSNIYVIDESIFFIACEKLLPIVDKYYININEMYSKENIYLPPELLNNTELPFKTRHTLCYYSLGKVVQTIIYKINTNDELRDNLTMYKEMRATLGDSPLFFCLDRATKENPAHRYLLYL